MFCVIGGGFHTKQQRGAGRSREEQGVERTGEDERREEERKKSQTFFNVIVIHFKAQYK